MVKLEKYDLFHTTTFWMARVNLLAHRTITRGLKRFNITPAQWIVLISLYKGKAATTCGLAKYVGKDKAAITRTLAILEKKGFLVRRRDRKDPNDRRSHKIYLTEKGKAVVPELITASKASDDMVFDGLENQDVFLFKAVINKLLRNYEVNYYF